MPALLEIAFQTLGERPRGLLGVPLHGLTFAALQSVDAPKAAEIHAAQVKPFRIGSAHWQGGEGTQAGHLTFVLAVLDDGILPLLQTALAAERTFESPDKTLRGQVLECAVKAQDSYEAIYARHTAAGVGGRDLHFRFATPTTFRSSELDLPFPLPKTLFYGLQARWEAFSDLHFGPDLNAWISRSVRVKDFSLRSRSVHFKGMREAALSACVGEVQYQIARPGDFEPTFVRLLADYARYAGVGYKTAYGLGHVETWGWTIPDSD